MDKICCIQVQQKRSRMPNKKMPPMQSDPPQVSDTLGGAFILGIHINAKKGQPSQYLNDCMFAGV